RSSLFDSADLDWRWDPVLREARQRHRPPSGGGQSLQERHGGASLRGARTSRRVTERYLTRRWSEPSTLLQLPRQCIASLSKCWVVELELVRRLTKRL